MEELAYGAVIGFKYVSTGRFSNLKFHTLSGDYELSYADPHCVQAFVNYLETRQIEDREQLIPFDKRVQIHKITGQS